MTDEITLTCKECGISILNSELFCNYCGQQNKDFNLGVLNSVIAEDYFSSIEEVKSLCVELRVGKHDGFLGRAERMLEYEPENGPMLFCEDCGKKVLDFVGGKLVEIE